MFLRRNQKSFVENHLFRYTRCLVNPLPRPSPDTAFLPFPPPSSFPLFRPKSMCAMLHPPAAESGGGRASLPLLISTAFPPPPPLPPLSSIGSHRVRRRRRRRETVEIVISFLLRWETAVTGGEQREGKIYLVNLKLPDCCCCGGAAKDARKGGGDGKKTLVFPVRA